MNDKERNKIQFMMNLYQRRVDNLQYAVENNPISSYDTLEVKTRIKAYKEFISDLKEFVSPKNFVRIS